MHKHVTILAALYIGFGIVLATVGLLLAVALPAIGLAIDDPEALPVLSTVGLLMGILFLLFSVPGIVGGIGLLKRRGWARILVLVLGAMHVFNIPMGTMLGIYTFWVLVQDETERMFERSAPAGAPAPA